MKIMIMNIKTLEYEELDINPEWGISFVADDGTRFDVAAVMDGTGINVQSVGKPGTSMCVMPRASNVVFIGNTK